MSNINFNFHKIVIGADLENVLMEQLNMKRVLSFIVLLHIALVQHGQIIADHTVVDKYDEIPQYYIDKVKEMWLNVPGESHATGYGTGLTLLEAIDPRYSVNVTTTGTPEGYTASHLRFSKSSWGNVDNATGWFYSYGEEDWFTSPGAIQRTKDGIKYCNTNDLEIDVIGFGWCWDMLTGSPTATYDPVYACR